MGVTPILLARHGDNNWFGILVNCFWAMYNVVLLSAAPYAALWRPRERQHALKTKVETIRTLCGVLYAR